MRCPGSVHKAHLEYVVLALGYCNGGCGRGQRENAVAVVLSGGSLARLGGYGAEGQLHAPVLQGVVALTAFSRRAHRPDSSAQTEYRRPQR